MRKTMNIVFWGLFLFLIQGLLSGCPNSGSSNGSAVRAGEEGAAFQALQSQAPTFADETDGMEFFFGSLHGHSTISGKDVQGSPQEVLTWARDEAGFDFYVLTDHGEGIIPREWKVMQVQTDAFTQDGVFVAMRGFEWSHPLVGHVCVYNTDTYTSSILLPFLNCFYRWVDKHDALTQFNHPGREPLVFQNLAYRETVADNFVAMETGNKTKGNASGEYLPYYPNILDEGWRVVPTNNQDNHSLNATSHRTAMVAASLSRATLLDAMRTRRIYSSDDPTMKVIFKLGDAWMGSEVTQPAGTATFTVWVQDDEPITKLTLYTVQGAVAAEQTIDDDQTEVNWTPAVDVSADAYFYLQVAERNTVFIDGNEPVQIAVTAPIWIKMAE